MTRSTLRPALSGALRKLHPRTLRDRPVIAIVWAGAALTTLIALLTPLGLVEDAAASPPGLTPLLAVWLWLTVLFANLAEAIAEGRGAAQAQALRATRSSTVARRLHAGTPVDRLGQPDLVILEVSSAELQPGDLVEVRAGDLVPGDGEVVHGVASVDESAITGESAPVIRESGGDRSAVTGGTRVLSDRVVVRISSWPGETFVDRMIALVEGASRRRTPNEIALGILLAALSIVFVVVVVTLGPIAALTAEGPGLPVLVALLVCLVPTTIGGLLSAIGIAGMDRLVRRNVLALSGRAVEAAGDVSTLLLDKTGTITYGSRRAAALLPLGDVDPDRLARAAAAASLADPTPEGASILDLVREGGADVDALPRGTAVPFTATTRMSGLDLADGAVLRKGAASAVTAWLAELGHPLEGPLAAQLDDLTGGISRSGGTPLVVAERTADGTARALGVVHLKDTVKEGLGERFAQLRAMGIRTVMVTGDNPITAAAIAREAGVDDHLAEATPEQKLDYIRREQAGGRLVAMTGDGTNDAPALAQADVGVAMNSGTSAAKEAGNMVDLDSDPTKLIEIVGIGKQLLITRGALTTFSIANDLAKYFAIVPALFASSLPQLQALNVMGLHSPASAVLSAVIFNALVIVALVPLALRGVRHRPGGAAALLRRNLLVYGLGGVIAPFLGIWAIDQLVRLLPGF
ncbi:potassium-transporting ATPase subunit KdpB [Brachybacterium horti]